MFAKEKCFHGFALTFWKDKCHNKIIYTLTAQENVLQFTASFIVVQHNTERKQATDWLRVNDRRVYVENIKYVWK